MTVCANSKGRGRALQTIPETKATQELSQIVRTLASHKSKVAFTPPYLFTAHLSHHEARGGTSLGLNY